MTLTPDFIALQEALIGRYSLERELGRGGMGVVYLARDVRLDRPVAIKVMHAALASQPDARERFLHEARTAAKLAHPHIIPIYSVESRDQLVFLVMALVDGETLGSRLRARGALPVDEAERVLREMAWALGYAHARGVVHRDLTLENVLLERGTGRALLVDFGLAGEHDVSDASPRFGTPGYLAPEVIRGDPASPSSDLYSLGVVAWTALVGRAPFEADTPGQLLAKHLVQAPKPLAPLARGASRRLIGAIEACLAKDAAARPADAAALLAMLERAPESVTVAPALREWFTRWERIRPNYAIATPALGVPIWIALWQTLQVGHSNFRGLLAPLLAIVAVPTIIVIQIASEASALRRLHSKSFGIEDIRAGYPHWRHELERERKRQGLLPLPGRVIFDLSMIGIVLSIVAVLTYPFLKGWFANDPGVAQYFQNLLIEFGIPIGGATIAGIAIGFVLPGFRLAPGGKIRQAIERFWGSSLARRLSHVAVAGQDRQLPASMTLHRNTELVLGLAVDDLWLAIPLTLREGLGDVPALAHTLQGSAMELRDLVDRISESERALLADGEEVTWLAATRVEIKSRHRETIVALERLRLQLLRLVATRQQSTELTQQIVMARQLEVILLRELAGHGEVRRLLHPNAKSRGMLGVTPSPTPA